MGNKEKTTRTTVRIFGEDHIIIGNKSPDYIKGLANSIDKQMWAIKEKNPKLSSTKIAIMTAMILADKLHSLKEECDQLYSMLIEYEEKKSEGKK
ncbi:cell division protein ZapA [Anaerobranca californiensis DSM 14826]|uniref:Cell division protein ZapA n=1 Tax=Anaerobranca californiensis DSM 14826 TaxID=1120989 RepID=A0A1M6PT25_9FIRM|nr:cell division protein ZapA [Anaerobranca californiensis]SHK11164.1 cell division protein ZapA [Anaerobranca californiensis DSM 14826]